MPAQLRSRNIASGRHGSVTAYPSTTAECGWIAKKSVCAPVGGRTNGSKPHDIAQEVRVLYSLNHPNIVKLLDYENDTLMYKHDLTLPFLPFTLADLNDRVSATDWIQSVAFQSLLGLAYIHDRGVAHRDIKPENIMIDWDGTVKLIDFGLIWTGGDIKEEINGEDEWQETKDDMICDVGTGRFRAPELLFSPQTYDACALDLWAIGVVITDFLFYVPIPDSDSEDEDELEDPFDPFEEEIIFRPRPRRILFDASFGDIGLAGNIFRVLGTPSEETWPEFSSLPDAGKIDFITCEPHSLKAVFPDTLTVILHLLTGLLQLSPSRRIPAKDAVRHPFFEEILVPDKGNIWFGDPRNDLSAMCLETKRGQRLVDLLAKPLEEKREDWPILPRPN